MRCSQLIIEKYVDGDFINLIFSERTHLVMRPFTRVMSWILFTGALFSLDGILYARTLGDVTVITLVFLAVANVLVALTFGRRSKIDATPLNLGRNPVPLVRE
jgi:hypothetical protein